MVFFLWFKMKNDEKFVKNQRIFGVNERNLAFLCLFLLLPQCWEFGLEGCTQVSGYIKLYLEISTIEFTGVNISLKIWNYSPANGNLFPSIVFKIHSFNTSFLKMFFKRYFYTLLTLIDCKVECFHIFISYFAMKNKTFFHIVSTVWKLQGLNYSKIWNMLLKMLVLKKKNSYQNVIFHLKCN